MTTGETALDEYAALSAKFFKLSDEEKPIPDELTAAMKETYSRMTEAEQLEYGAMCEADGMCRP